MLYVASRRVNHASPVSVLTRALKPKRRRSAQPALGAPPARLGQPSQPVLAEESEPEEELAPRKVSRSKKNVRPPLAYFSHVSVIRLLSG